MQSPPYTDLGPALLDTYFALKFCNCARCGAELLGDDDDNIRHARMVYRFDRPEPLPERVAARVPMGCRDKPFCKRCARYRNARVCDSLCALMRDQSGGFEWPKLHLKNVQYGNCYEWDEDDPGFENAIRCLEDAEE
jgi:hypothetical protein